MINVAASPLIVSLGATYRPPVVRVLLLPADTRITSANYRHDYLDNVELSTPAKVYLTGLTGPGPDYSQGLTQTSAGPVISFIAGDYTGAVLVGQDLEGAVFDGANLQDVNFYSANLQGAQFFNTPVQGAQFDQADLRGANLTAAVGLQPQQVYRAIFDGSTAFPPEFDDTIYGPFGRLGGVNN